MTVRPSQSASTRSTSSTSSAALDEEEVVLSLSGELDPAVVRPQSERQFLAVVMPMRI